MMVGVSQEKHYGVLWEHTGVCIKVSLKMSQIDAALHKAR